MPWCDYSYYTADYKGTTIQETEWSYYYDRAEETLNTITRGQIPDDITTLTTKTQKAIKRAVCYQADYFAEYGIDVGFSMDNSFTVGKVSVSEGNESDAVKRAKRVCPVVIMILEQTGLMNRAVGVIC